MARTKAVTLEDGALPQFDASATVTKPVDSGEFSLNVGVELMPDGSVKTHGANVHKAVSPLTGNGLPDGFVMPSGSVVTQR